MGFRDPIVSGEELVRSAISSEDFETGVTGWRIARDGQAEFNTLSVRDTISVDNLIVNGDDVAELITARPLGLVAYHSRQTTSPTVGQNITQASMRLSFTSLPGRMYKVCWRGGVYTNGAGRGYVVPKIWWTNNGAEPTTASQMLEQTAVDMPGGGMVMPFKIERHIFTPGGGPVKFLMGFTTLTPAGQTFALYGGFDYPNQAWVEDLGTSFPAGGIDDNGAAAPPKVLKTFDIQPYASRSYAGNGDPLDYDNQYMMSGDIHIDGNRRSWMWFDANRKTGGNGLGSMNDMQGVAAADISYLDVFLYFPHWYTSAGGRTTIGVHGINAVTEWEQLNGVYGQKEAFWEGRNIGKWVSLKGTGIESAAMNGNFEGLILGNTGDANINNYGYAYGANGINGQQPGLRAGYYK